jgi:RNA polymerase sigma factor (TIGR02999 family)
MRRILIDNARRKASPRHGGDRVRVGLEAVAPAAPLPDEDLLALDEALTKLAAVDATAAELVRLRYFAGLSIPEAARVLGLPPRSTDRLWAYARTWLRDCLQRE